MQNHPRRGIFYSWPSDHGWRARIRPGEGEREEPAGTVTPAAALHCRRQETRRRAWFGGYGPQFEEPRAPGERGGAGELAKAKEVAGERGQGGGRHGRRPRAFGARGYGAGNHLTPKKRAGEKEESKGRLTAGNSVTDSARGRRRRGR